jgi:hypothetical protein
VYTVNTLCYAKASDKSFAGQLRQEGAVSWNYRVFLCTRSDLSGAENGVASDLVSESWLELRETYYSVAGRVNGWSSATADVSGVDLEWVLKAMTEALSKPVLDGSTGAEIGSYDEIRKRLDESSVSAESVT